VILGGYEWYIDCTLGAGCFEIVHRSSITSCFPRSAMEREDGLPGERYRGDQSDRDRV
jgi:hypothetical protein